MNLTSYRAETDTEQTQIHDVTLDGDNCWNQSQLTLVHKRKLWFESKFIMSQLCNAVAKNSILGCEKNTQP